MAQVVRLRGHMVDDDYMEQVEFALYGLQNIVTRNRQMAPVLLRLAFHDAGTYDARTRTGGPNGSIRNELNNPTNGGIKSAIDFVEPVKQDSPMISYADLYQLAGVVALMVTGGPDIDFVVGRRDNLNRRDSGSLPNPSGGAQHLRDIFYRMGFSDKEIVALSGAHTLGRAHRQISGFNGPFTSDPLKFDNSYFVELMEGETQGLVKFPTDQALMQDPAFRRYVELYADDEETFFEDYAKAHKKMSELGFLNHPRPREAQPKPQPQRRQAA